MSHIYKNLKEEILRGHAINGYRQAKLRPLRDKYNLKPEVKTKYRKIAQQLSDDPAFPSEIKIWFQGKSLKSGYKSLNKE